MSKVIDIIPTQDLSVEVDERGVSIVTAIVIKEGPLRYVRPGGPRWELIPETELRDEAFLETLAAAPVTDGHPPDFVSEEDVKDFTSGVGDTKIEIFEDDEGLTTVEQRLILHDPDLARDIETGKKQVSTGRDVDFDHSPGEFGGVEYEVVQRNMKVNHIAIVEEGRCGKECSIIPSGVSEGQEVELDPDVKGCVEELEGEGRPAGEAIPICRESVDAAGGFRNRILSIMDPMEGRNGKIIKRIANVTHKDPNDIQEIIAENQEPDRGDMVAFAQVLGVTKARMRRIIEDAFGEKVFDSKNHLCYCSNASVDSTEKFESELNQTSEEKIDMEFELYGDTLTIDGVECEDCAQKFEKVIDKAESKIKDALYSLPTKDDFDMTVDSDKLEDFLTNVLDSEEGHVKHAVKLLAKTEDEKLEEHAQKLMDELELSESSEDEEEEDATHPDMMEQDQPQPAQEQSGGGQLNELVKNAREQAGLSLEEMAESLPVTPKILEMIEGGEMPVPDDLLQPMLEELDLDATSIVEALTGGDGEDGEGESEDQAEDSERAAEVMDEATDLIATLKTVDRSYQAHGKSLKDVQKDVIEKIGGAKIQDMSEERRKKVEDNDGYREALVDQILLRDEESEAQDSAEQEQQEQQQAEDEEPEGVEPEVTAVDSESSSNGAPSEQELQELRNLHTDRDSLREYAGRS